MDSYARWVHLLMSKTIQQIGFAVNTFLAKKRCIPTRDWRSERQSVGWRQKL